MSEDLVIYHSVRACVDNTDTDIKRQNCEETVDKPDSGDCGEENKPEVEKDVNLFIDDVQRKDTESIVLLNCP